MVQYSVDYPDRPLNRMTSFFRLLMIIPIGIVLALIDGGGYASGGSGKVAGAVGLVVLPTLLLILFRQKYARRWFDWNLELMRFSARVGVYLSLIDNRHPSTDEQQAVHLEFSIPMRATTSTAGCRSSSGCSRSRTTSCCFSSTSPRSSS